MANNNTIVLTNNQYYGEIADAIREKNGTETTYKPSQMAAAIMALDGGNTGLQNLVDGSATGSVRGIDTTIENENYTIGTDAVALGAGTKASGKNSFAEGYVTTASGESSHTEGGGTTASGTQSHAEGGGTKATNKFAHAEGAETTASGDSSHAEGGRTQATNIYAHVEGSGSRASGASSHAEGSGTTASGSQSHAEGAETIASGSQSHAEGGGSRATNNNAHAEGSGSLASGASSHAEGGGTTASGASSHAEGSGTTASGSQSHAEGGGTTASGYSSHAEGDRTIANHRSQHVFGEYNVEDSSTAEASERGNFIEIVGNGSNSDNKHNARSLDWDGNEYLSGGLTTYGGIMSQAGTLRLGQTTITEAQLQSLLALIAGEEATVLFEASFHIDDTAEDSYYCFDESVPSEYGTAPGLQDIMQITSLNEVKVTFDGNEFTVPISSSTTQDGYPSYSFGNSKENGFSAFLIKWKPSSVSDCYDRLDIWTYSDGDHTIKVETV